MSGRMCVASARFATPTLNYDTFGRGGGIARALWCGSMQGGGGKAAHTTAEFKFYQQILSKDAPKGAGSSAAIAAMF